MRGFAQTHVTDSDYQYAVGSRLDQLASKLNDEADHLSKLEVTLHTPHLNRLPDILSQANQSSSGARLISKELAADIAELSHQNKSQLAITQRAVLDDAAEKQRALADYSIYLRQLAADVKQTPSDRVRALLDKAYVPSQLKPIIAESTGLPISIPQGSSNLSVVSQLDLSTFVLGGLPTVDYPAVGDIIFNSPVGPSTWCTGTLIESTVVLTAAHCLAAARSVFFQHSGTYEIDKVIGNDRYLPPSPFADIGLIVLKKEVKGIKPADINDSTPLPSSSIGTIVGFGWHSKNASSAASHGDNIVRETGIKVQGYVSTSVCPAPNAGQSLICWNYGQGGVLTQFGSTCFGDSGGPLFVDIGGEWRIAGVTEGGVRTCMPGDAAWDVDVYKFKSWISGHIAPYRRQHVDRSSLKPLVNDSSRFIVKESDLQFSEQQRTWSQVFTIERNVKAAAVGVNAIPSGAPLAVRVGKTGATPACIWAEQSSVFFCSFEASAGSWALQVSGNIGQEYQVVVTTFGGR